MGLISRREALTGAFATLSAGLARARPAPLKLKRGVNAFPWFALTREYPAPSRDYGWPPFAPDRPVPTPRDLSTLRAAGFDFLRLPIDPGPFLAGAPRERAALLEDLDAAVGQANAADLNVVVVVTPNEATHYWTAARMAGSIRAPEFSAYQRLVGELAARLPARRNALELVNEPPGACASPDTRAVRASLVARARKASADLTLVVSGGCGSMIAGLADFDTAGIAGFAPLLYTFHFYEPYLFSHQGAPWIGEKLYRNLTGVPWPGDAGAYAATMAETRAQFDADLAMSAVERKAVWAETEKVMKVYFDAHPARPFIDGYMAQAEAWAKKHDIGAENLLLGEFGALRRDAKYSGARAPDRARYIKDVRESAERYGFPWAFWCLFDGMGLMDERTRALDPAMVEALGLKLSRK